MCLLSVSEGIASCPFLDIPKLCPRTSFDLLEAIHSFLIEAVNYQSAFGGVQFSGWKMGGLWSSLDRK